MADPEPSKELELRRQELAEHEAQLERNARLLMEHINATRIVASDLQDALYLLKDYQNVIARLFAPDPNLGSANKLLRKYQIEPGKASEFFKVFISGLDITDPTELTDLETIFDHAIFDAESTATEEAGELTPGVAGELPSGDT